MDLLILSNLIKTGLVSHLIPPCRPVMNGGALRRVEFAISSGSAMTNGMGGQIAMTRGVANLLECRKPPMKVPRLPVWLCVAFALLGISALPASGQVSPSDATDIRRMSILPPDFVTFSYHPSDDTSAPNPWSRCRLFRMPVGVSSDILNSSTEPDDPTDALEKTVADWRQIQVALGADTPYWDFRRPGDVGGVGFYKLQSAFPLFDGGSTGLGMAFQAVTPAGWETGGVEHGPTVVNPNLAWFYELGGGTAVQGFVGKSLHLHSNWSDGLGHSVRYGLALHSPCPGFDSGPDCRTNLFLEALGRNHFNGEINPRSSTNLELIPGIQWRWSDTGWISSGLLMPVNELNPIRPLWQLTCTWQY
jgi:hypothetical protein